MLSYNKTKKSFLLEAHIHLVFLCNPRLIKQPSAGGGEYYNCVQEITHPVSESALQDASGCINQKRQSKSHHEADTQTGGLYYTERARKNIGRLAPAHCTALLGNNREGTEITGGDDLPYFSLSCMLSFRL
jgi:hypothetical protein